MDVFEGYLILMPMLLQSSPPRLMGGGVQEEDPQSFLMVSECSLLCSLRSSKVASYLHTNKKTKPP